MKPLALCLAWFALWTVFGLIARALGVPLWVALVIAFVFGAIALDRLAAPHGGGRR